MAQASNQRGKGRTPPQKWSHALIALGSNKVFRTHDLTSLLGVALEKLSHKGVTIRAISEFYLTPCFPAGAGPDFVNAAASVETNLSAHEFLGVLHEVEAELGRTRTQRWSQRTLDLDLLGFDNLVCPDVAEFRRWQDLEIEKQAQIAPEELILPHPRLHDRPFVLIPLSDIAPDWVHPVSGLSVTQMCAALPEADVAAVKLLVNPQKPA